MVYPIIVQRDSSEVAKAAITPKAMITLIVANQGNQNLYWLFFGIGFQGSLTSDVALTGKMLRNRIFG